MKRNHRSLKAWQESIVLVEHIYKATRSFPKDEIFGLVSQMRRSAVSVPANIAEGSARSGTKELLQFLSIAAASLSELDTHVEIASRLGYVKDDALIREIDDVRWIDHGADRLNQEKYDIAGIHFTLHAFTLPPSPRRRS